MDVYLLKNILISLNYFGEIAIFHNPVEALASARSNNQMPDLIFLDLNTPEMHGYEFLESLIKISDPQKNKYKIVIVTSSDCPEDIERSAKYLQVVDFIIKPPQKIDFLTKESLANLVK
jgi:CheY-like chemotaxis protein